MEDMFDTKKQFETWPETMSKSKTGDKQVKGDKTLKVLFPHHNIFFFLESYKSSWSVLPLYFIFQYVLSESIRSLLEKKIVLSDFFF